MFCFINNSQFWELLENMKETSLCIGFTSYFVFEVASLSKFAMSFFEKDFAFLGSEIHSQIGVHEQLLKPVGELALLFVRTCFVIEIVSAKFHFNFSFGLELCVVVWTCRIWIIAHVFLLQFVCKSGIVAISTVFHASRWWHLENLIWKIIPKW